MTMTRFEETIPQQAARLRVTERWVSTRRQVLVRKLAGEVVRQETNVVSYELAGMSVDELLALLAVEFMSGDVLRPVEVDWTIHRADYSDYALGGNSREKLNPPFGYRLNSRGDWESDGEAGETVRIAFRQLAENIRDHRQPLWSDVAESLNRMGRRTKNGGRWGKDDVRSLPRALTYAGYGYHSKNREFWRVAEIPNPLVEPAVFLSVALFAGSKVDDWIGLLRQEAGTDIRP